MKKLIENYWKDMDAAIMGQDKNKITQHFAKDAVYKCRVANEMLIFPFEEMAKSCLEYKEIIDKEFKDSIDSIDELKDGRWVSVITSSVSKKPYFTLSYFKFKNEKIVELVEYYGDFE